MTYPFILPPLPYPPAALEPNLGRSSVRLHHDAFFAAYAVEPFDQVRKRYCSVPPLPIRLAGRVLSPEVKAKIRQKLQ